LEKRLVLFPNPHPPYLKEGRGLQEKIMPRPFTLEEYQKLAIEAMKYLVEASAGEAEAFFENSQWDSRDYYREEIIEHISDVEYLLGEMRKMLYRKPDANRLD
jgi:hypothetical protein